MADKMETLLDNIRMVTLATIRQEVMTTWSMNEELTAENAKLRAENIELRRKLDALLKQK